MGAILLEIINNRVIQAAALAWAIAQAIKVLLTLAISRKFDHTRVLGSGGMPSSHSSMAAFTKASLHRSSRLRSALRA